MLLLIAMTAVGPMSLNIVMPALPGLASGLATDTSSAQFTVSLFLLGLASAQLVIGPLADKFGRRPVLLAGFAIAVVGCIGCFVAASISQLIVARIAQAIGTATGVVVSRAIIRDIFERDRAASMFGLVATAMVVAPMIAPLIGGLLDTTIGWRAIFIFTAACVLAVLVWAAVALPETRGIHHAGEAGFATDVRALLGSAPFYGYVLAGGFGSASYFAFLGGGPHVTVTVMGRSSAEYGLWFALAAIGYMAGNFTVARLTTRYGIHAMILWGLIIEAVALSAGVLLALVAHDLGPIILFLPQTVSAFGNGLLMPPTIAGAISVRPQASGTAAGLTGFMQMGLGAAALQLAGYVSAAAVTAVPLAVTMAAMVVPCALAFALVRPRDLWGQAKGA